MAVVEDFDGSVDERYDAWMEESLGTPLPVASPEVEAASERLSKLKPKRAKSAARKRDANRTRYLFAPSAMMLEPGEAYFSQ